MNSLLNVVLHISEEVFLSESPIVSKYFITQKKTKKGKC